MPSDTAQPDARSDEQLIAVANAGGADAAEAFEALYRRYRQWVANLALRFTGDRDAAADVTQEVFIYFLRKFPGFVLTARLTTFLYPAVKNVSIAHRRKTQRFAGSDEALAAMPGPDPTDPADDADRTRIELAGVLQALSDGHREVVLLRFVDGLSLQEIADALGVPLGTVKSRLHNALATLREDERTRKYFQP